MKCRYIVGNKSAVVNTSRFGVVDLGSRLMVGPEVSLFAVNRQIEPSGPPLWWPIWWRDRNGAVVFNDDGNTPVEQIIASIKTATGFVASTEIERLRLFVKDLPDFETLPNWKNYVY